MGQSWSTQLLMEFVLLPPTNLSWTCSTGQSDVASYTSVYYGQILELYYKHRRDKDRNYDGVYRFSTLKPGTCSNSSLTVSILYCVYEYTYSRALV